MMKVLFASSNPTTTSRLRLDEEVREIREKTGQANSGKCIEFIPILAARPDDLLQWLNKHSDARVLHFAGHGEGEGIILQDEDGNPKEVGLRAIADLLRSVTSCVSLVFLGACYTAERAERLTEAVDFVVAMSGDVVDETVGVFSASFYRAIGFGRTVWEAYEQGRAAVRLQGLPDADRPMLYCKRGADPAALVLCDRAIVGGNDNGHTHEHENGNNGNLRRARYDGYKGAMRAVDSRLSGLEKGMGMFRTMEKDIAVLRVGFENQLNHQGQGLTSLVTQQAEATKQIASLAQEVAMLREERRVDREDRRGQRADGIAQWAAIILLLIGFITMALGMVWRFGAVS